MSRLMGPPRVVRSVSLSLEFDELCREHNISVSEACRVGISIILAEKGVADYDNRLNLYRKMIIFKEELEALSQKYKELLAKNEQRNN